MNKGIAVAVLGSTGYVGLELIKILQQHPNVNILFLGCENFPNLEINFLDKEIDGENLPKLNLNENFNPKNFDIVFLALPHGISNKYVKKLYDKIKIIDLSGDFRLDKIDTYKTNYDDNHACPDLLDKFVYGLPEFNKAIIQGKFNIAVPGCYPTSILIPLIPLLNNDFIKTENIIIDSKSGYSGAGKKFDKKKINDSKNLNFYNYNTNNHRHMCEIKQELEKYTNKKINFSFNPHILPIYRGMMSTIYCDIGDSHSFEEIDIFYKKFFKSFDFVDYLDNEKIADFFSVQNTNKCLIKTYKNYNDNKIIIVSLIDNLLKGASGQAVQNFNLLYGFNETLGLIKKK